MPTGIGRPKGQFQPGGEGCGSGIWVTLYGRSAEDEDTELIRSFFRSKGIRCEMSTAPRRDLIASAVAIEREQRTHAAETHKRIIAQFRLPDVQHGKEKLDEQ